MASVMLVDANDSWLDSLALLIAAEGHLVRTAHNGADALRFIRESSPDVVVTDCKVPVMDGVDLIRALRADPSSASIPVIRTAKRVRGCACRMSVSSKSRSQRPFCCASCSASAAAAAARAKR
ncbi:response regulator [Paraburkholderia sp. RL18-101-BIB-B]|uniref:response regulator n=1 Tax=Paraburkholderia sp. RL18-101-BIB-B TaxID=3031634 RepID=UPI0038BCF1A5